MKKRKTAKTATSSKRSAAAIKSHPHLDNSTEEKNSVEESKDTVQEQSEGTAATIIEPSLGETTVKYAEPTLVENNLELSNEPMMKDSIKSDIYIYNAETSSDATQELTEKAVLTVTNGTENSTEKNIETLPVSDPIEIPVVGIPKLETSVSFPYQRVINCYAVLSDDLRTNLKMDNVIVKKEAGLDAKEVEGSDNDEGAILNKDDSDWEPNIKKRKKNSGSSARSSLKVPADQEGPRFCKLISYLVLFDMSRIIRKAAF